MKNVMLLLTIITILGPCGGNRSKFISLNSITADHSSDQNSKQNNENTPDSRESAINKIQILEKELNSSPNNMGHTQTEELIKLYCAFADTYKNDPEVPLCIYKAANLSMITNNNEQAITYIDRLINQYPDFNKIPEACFLKAYIYDNNLKDVKKAREAYNLFLAKFPDHNLAADARLCIDNLGKTPEQLIKEFEKKEKRKKTKK